MNVAALYAKLLGVNAIFWGAVNVVAWGYALAALLR